MKLTAEQLSLHLAHGDWVAMKHVSEEWKVFMYKKNNGYFQGTGFDESIEDSLCAGFSFSSFSEEEIENDFTEYKIIKPAPKLMKAGDKCQIIDTPELRELLSKQELIEEEIEDMLELLFFHNLEIKSSDRFEYDIYSKDKSYYFSFPHWAVARDFSEEVKEEETLSGKEITVIFDGKEYTAVIK